MALQEEEVVEVAVVLRWAEMVDWADVAKYECGASNGTIRAD